MTQLLTWILFRLGLRLLRFEHQDRLAAPSLAPVRFHKTNLTYFCLHPSLCVVTEAGSATCQWISLSVWPDLCLLKPSVSNRLSMCVVGWVRKVSVGKPAGVVCISCPVLGKQSRS